VAVGANTPIIGRRPDLVAARYRAGIIALAPVRPRIGADHAAAGADHARPERRHRDGFRVVVNVEHDHARAGAAVHQQRAHAVRPHVAERHGADFCLRSHAICTIGDIYGLQLRPTDFPGRWSNLLRRR
jgi:hypothetical protein